MRERVRVGVRTSTGEVRDGGDIDGDNQVGVSACDAAGAETSLVEGG